MDNLFIDGPVIAWMFFEPEWKPFFSFQVRRAAAAEATEAEAAAPAAAHRVGREVAEIQVSLNKKPTS